MADTENHDTKVSRREAFGLSSAALAAAAALAIAGASDAHASPQTQKAAAHTAPNEIDPGPQNLPLAAENPDSEWAPPTDHGTVKPFKYSFSLAHKRVESGGWTRQVTRVSCRCQKTSRGWK
jgi:oxalate decarboxylase